MCIYIFSIIHFYCLYFNPGITGLVKLILYEYYSKDFKDPTPF